MTINLMSSVPTLSQQLSNGNLSSIEIDNLQASNLLSLTDADTLRSYSSLPEGLPGSSAAAASAAGLTATGSDQSSSTATSPSAGNSSDTQTITAQTSDITDNRLRISEIKGQESQIYGDNDKSKNILTPLYATGGLMFPFTPSIQVAGETEWTPHSLTHTNYDIYSYQRTPSASINISGKFTVQNQREGEYALACIHFLRTMGKMYYGEQDSSDYQSARDQAKSNAGLPPPVLRLRGYGLYMFNDLRCVLKGYNFNYEENMDLVTIKSQASGDVMLPALFTLTVSILLQQNSTRLRKEFKLDDFRTGALMRTSSTGGWF